MNGVYVDFGWWDLPILAAVAVMLAAALLAVWREVR